MEIGVGLNPSIHIRGQVIIGKTKVSLSFGIIHISISIKCPCSCIASKQVDIFF